MNAIDRVLARSVAGHNGCLIWTGAKTPQGYGQINWRGRRIGVHRVAYISFKGSIPQGLEIDHLCRVRHCLNPFHLEAVTHAENVRRSIRPARPPRSPITHCRNGHEMTFANAYIRPDGNRDCRICKKATRARSKAARRG